MGATEREYYRSWGLALLSLWREAAADVPGMADLQPPRFVVGVDLGETLAQWHLARRTIEVSARLLREFDWDNIEGVVRHEMAHQVVDELFGMADAPAHGEAFARACKLLGVPTSARWRQMPAAGTAEPMVMRIRKLLALAESDNANEAAAALAKARALAAKHDVDMLSSLGGDDQSPVSLRPLGRSYKRIPGWYWFVMSIIEQCAFVQYVCRAVDDGRAVRRQMEIYGAVEHLDLADYLHDFLLTHGERLWWQRRRQGGLSPRMKGSYLKGLFAGVATRLQETESSPEIERAALVALDDPRLEALFKRRNPRVRTVKRAVSARRDAMRQGEADSNRLQLQPGLRQANGLPQIEG